MKLYVAGSWNEKENMNNHMEYFKSLGHTITHNWAKYEADLKKSKSVMAVKDINGVIEADAYIGMYTNKDHIYRGSFTELGAAIAIKKLHKKDYKIFVLCPEKDANVKSCVFFNHPYIQHFITMEELVKKL